ncbi:MAG: type II 3-dehydroquinate dehydratase [Cytophagales bacterium]|nr:type II 3-dehydroquinate dehydratase [Bernardetiaceae bacterium]MDW8205232.1 type II 3-dehydroquinate dehydratase [Cytophagales bacterium]
MTEIIIINGPNLNLLGKREPEIYGSITFENFFNQLKKEFSNSIHLSYFQSNHEGLLIDKLHEVGFSQTGIVLNAGGLTHTSVALGDAVAAISSPVVEVHISNIHIREPFRHHSYISLHAKGSIVGCGLNGYRLAVMHLLHLFGKPFISG